MKIKSLGFGIVLGLFIGVTITAVAQQVYEAYTNSFPVYVNGKQKDIEGYNINGSTYFKLRDLGSFIGFDVDFKEGNILIETSENNDNITTPHNDVLLNDDAKQCASMIDNMLQGKNFELGLMSDSVHTGYTSTDLNLILNNTFILNNVAKVDGKSVYSAKLLTNSGDVLLEDLDIVVICERICLTPEYFVNTILPLDK